MSGAHGTAHVASAAYANLTHRTRRFTVSATYAERSDTATYVGHARGMSGFFTSAFAPPLSSLPYLPNVVIGLLFVSTTSTRNCPRFGKNTRPNGSTSNPEPSHMQCDVLPDMCAEYGE